jgi:hypothetical protein
VPAPPVQIVIPVSPGWLPADLQASTFTYTYADLVSGARILAYVWRPESEGVESVTIYTGAPGPPIAPPRVDEGDTHAERTIEIHGQQADEVVGAFVSESSRACSIGWTEPSGLVVNTVVMERTTSTETSCQTGEQFARSLQAQPLELARTVILGLVPVGYDLRFTGTNGEQWCPVGSTGGCIEIQDGHGYGPLQDAVPVTVRGHQGYLSDDGGIAVLVVPGFVRLELSPGMPTSVDASQDAIVRLAAAAILDRAGW